MRRMLMMSNNTRFSIIGSGYFIKIFNKEHPLYQALANIKHHDPVEYLLDVSLFKTLKLNDKYGAPYNNFYEVRANSTFPVYCTDMYTRLEIRKDGSRKTSKIFFKELVRNDYLFEPEYVKNDLVLSNEGLMVLEYDKGHMGVTVHPRPFDTTINKLLFELITIPEINETCIRYIHVDSNEVILKQPDTLNYAFKAFII